MQMRFPHLVVRSDRSFPFRKSLLCGVLEDEACPSSQELLEFQKGDLSRIRSAEVRKHLRACEFCDSEVGFYSHYPQDDMAGCSADISEIPAPLFELAEALLKNRAADSTALNTLLRESEELIADGAV